MDPILSSILSGLVGFFATQVDEFFVLVLYFSRCRPRGPLTVVDVVTGNLLGNAAVLLFSGVGVLLGAFFPEKYIKLLGLLPIFLGCSTLLKRTWRRLKKAKRVVPVPVKDVEKEQSIVSEELSGGTPLLNGEEHDVVGESDESPESMTTESSVRPLFFLRPGVVEVFCVSLGNGTEEISVYASLLITPSLLRIITTLAVLIAMVFVWLALALSLVRCKAIAKKIEDYGEAFEPWLLIALGVYILFGSVMIPVQL